jgi:hypothetical protein
MVFESSLAVSGGSSDLVGELLAVSKLIHSDPEVELAVGSKRAPANAKAHLVGALIGGKVSAEAEAIVRHLVADPRGRRIGRMLMNAAEIVADQGGKGLAVEHVAKPQKPKSHHLAEITARTTTPGGSVRERSGRDVRLATAS